jgi:hypothetical protein
MAKAASTWRPSFASDGARPAKTKPSAARQTNASAARQTIRQIKRIAPGLRLDLQHSPVCGQDPPLIARDEPRDELLEEDVHVEDEGVSVLQARGEPKRLVFDEHAGDVEGRRELHVEARQSGGRSIEMVRSDRFPAADFRHPVAQVAQHAARLEVLRAQQQAVDDMPEHPIQWSVRGELIVDDIEEMPHVRTTGELAPDLPPAAHHRQRVLHEDV